MKKTIALALALIMVFACVCSCCDEKQGESDRNANNLQECYKTNNNLFSSSEKNSECISESDMLSHITAADFKSYDSIIMMYKKIVQLCIDYDEKKAISGEYDAMFYIPGEKEYKWYEDIFHSTYLIYPGRYEKNKNENYINFFGYALKDLNNDGTDELVLLLNDYTVIAIFSICEEHPVLLGHYNERNRAWIDNEGNIYVNGSSGVAFFNSSMYRVAPNCNELSLIWEIGACGMDNMGKIVYYITFGHERKQISEKEFDLIIASNPYLSDSKIVEDAKENSHLNFVFLFGMLDN